jgi:hypothetical protein
MKEEVFPLLSLEASGLCEGRDSRPWDRPFSPSDGAAAREVEEGIVEEVQSWQEMRCVRDRVRESLAIPRAFSADELFRLALLHRVEQDRYEFFRSSSLMSARNGASRLAWTRRSANSSGSSKSRATQASFVNGSPFSSASVTFSQPRTTASA